MDRYWFDMARLNVSMATIAAVSGLIVAAGAPWWTASAGVAAGAGVAALLRVALKARP